jgi:hypothetical protein
MVTTSWFSLTAFLRHGPIGAVLPRRGGFPAVQPRRHLLGTDPTAKVYAEVYAVREHAAWGLASLATR